MDFLMVSFFDYLCSFKCILFLFVFCFHHDFKNNKRINKKVRTIFTPLIWQQGKGALHRKPQLFYQNGKRFLLAINVPNKTS